jgi:hypothetical protein
MTDIEPGDTAVTAAFEELRREISLARRAVEGLTAERSRVPDYSPALAQMDHRLAMIAAAAERIEEAPAVHLSPDALMVEIVKAGGPTRAADAKLIHDAHAALSQALGQVDGLVKRSHATDQRLRERLWEAAGAMVVGMLIWSMLPGAVARALPGSWHVPQWMAMRTLRGR